MSASKDEGNRLDLLLADADERRPVLEEGLPGEVAQQGPKPKKATQQEKPDWRRDNKDQNDLKEQGWGLVVPDGRAGDRLREALTPLIRLREEELGKPAEIYRVSPDMSARAAADWTENVYWANDVPDEDRPLYLLMLGDLHETQAELQHSLANGALVGRIHFTNAKGETDLDGYAAYADKVVRYAREATTFTTPDMAYFAARDGTAATHTAEMKLVRPSFDASEQARVKGSLAAAKVRRIEAETVDELLAEGGGAAGARPSVLLSVTHGMGPPRRGWSPEEAQQRQGALILDRDEVLDAERLLGQRFLPGGMWFCLACYGGGTPSASAYYAWLSQLAAQGAWSGKAASVLNSLPKDGQRPFVAAMPQAALRNPEGPLGVIGHLDLAWTYGFTGSKDLSESRSSRFTPTLHALVDGARAGVALGILLRSYRKTNDDLTSLYDGAARSDADSRSDPTDLTLRGHLWMLRNDLRGYVLLGDPAARLPLKQHALAPKAREAQAAPAGIPELRGDSIGSKAASAPEGSAGPVKGGAGALISAIEKEKAVRAVLIGDEAPRTIAARLGVPLEELWAWFDAYRAGGLARLSE
jgi:hypothetical protein